MDSGTLILCGGALAAALIVLHRAAVTRRDGMVTLRGYAELLEQTRRQVEEDAREESRASHSASRKQAPPAK